MHLVSKALFLTLLVVGCQSPSGNTVVTPTTPTTGYSVLYDGNGNTSGAVPVDANKYQSNALFTVLGNTGNLAKATPFSSFSGWSDTAAGTYFIAVGTQQYAYYGRDTVLYAQWGGAVTTLAGSVGVMGLANGTGTQATFHSPEGIVSDGTALYLADSSNNQIRKIVISTGVVTTLAGSATGASGSADGAGTAASFNSPNGITILNGNLYVADAGTGKIRKIVISSAAVTTLASGFQIPAAMATDGTNLFVSDTLAQTISEVLMPSGAVVLLAGSGYGFADGSYTAAKFKSPSGLACDGTSLYIADGTNARIRKLVIASGVVTTLAGSGTYASTDATGAAASFTGPTGIATDGVNLFVVDGNRIRKVVIGTAAVTTIAGSGYGSSNGAGAATSFNAPMAIAVAGSSLYVADTGNQLIRSVQ